MALAGVIEQREVYMEKTYDNDEIEIDLIELLYALKKRALIIVAVLLAGALIAGVYTRMLLTPVYSATSTVLVISKETTLTSLADLQFGSQLAKDYSVLITSRSVLEEVLGNLGLDREYRDLRENVTVNNLADTRILELTVTDPDPALAKQLVDELAKVSSAYIGDKMEVIPPKVIEEAELPESPSSPSLSKNVALGALAGLILSAGVVILMTIMDDSIRSEDDIERYLKIPTLASIPDRKDYVSDKAKKKTRRKRKRRKNR